MSNIGKKMINWKKDFPVLRAALGLLGREGYTSMMVARYILDHSCSQRVRDVCETKLGRTLNAETIQSRLKRVEELAWIEQHDPTSYKKGKILKIALASELKRAGLESYGAKG